MRSIWAGVLALLLVAAWGVVADPVGEAADPVQIDICMDVLPAMLEEGEAAEITGIFAAGAGPGVILHYDSRALDGRGRTPADLVCLFEGRGLDPAAAILSFLRTENGPLGDAQLYFLKRFWLADGVAVKEARARLVSFAPLLRWSVLGDVPAETGYFFQQFVNAAAPATLYGLLALAYGLIYGLTNRINLAFGDMATLGAFAALSGAAGAATLGLGAGIAMVAAAALAAAASAALWGAVFGAKVAVPLLARSPQILLVATTGVAVAVQEFLARSQGVRDRWLPPVLSARTRLAEGAFPVEITTMQIVIVVGGAMLAAGTILLLHRTGFGRRWKAVADDSTMASLLGIDVNRTVIATFALATGLAGAGGAVLTLHYGGTSFHMGTVIGLKALVGAIIGGIGSPVGALLGGIAVGVIETLWSAYHSLIWREVAILSLLAVFLVLRPTGLFGARS